MVEDHVERKLAAIFAGDVAGYSCARLGFNN